ncbi:MAG: DNA repair protein RadC [Bacteroidales bacterium]|jgi:DNA repair protein RadC|nr:DNA repair protein RadC [Bacteroidales bacterium]
MEDKLKKISEWSEDDRPREKLMLKGVKALSDSELLAILINSGSTEKTAVDLAREILKFCDNDLNKLSKLSYLDIKNIENLKGIGDAKAITIVAALELGRRRPNPEQNIKIKTSRDIFDAIKPLFQDLNHEEFYAIYLSRNNSIINKIKISQGGTSKTVVDNKLILREALLNHASSIIVAHNHPSGNLKPSKEDVNTTIKLKEAAKNFDIDILDHIIIGNNEYYSFAENLKL